MLIVFSFRGETAKSTDRWSHEKRTFDAARHLNDPNRQAGISSLVRFKP
jgi:hypothetical protein